MHSTMYRSVVFYSLDGFGTLLLFQIPNSPVEESCSYCFILQDSVAITSTVVLSGRPPPISLSLINQVFARLISLDFPSS